MPQPRKSDLPDPDTLGAPAGSATPNGHTPQPENPEDGPVVFLVDGEEHTMRRQEECGYDIQIASTKQSLKLRAVQEYYQIEDDDDDDDDDAALSVPPEAVRTWTTTMRRLAKLGFPTIPAETWPKLSPTDITALGGAFLAEMNRATNGTVRRLTNPTLTASSVKLPSYNGSMEPVAPLSGLS